MLATIEQVVKMPIEQILRANRTKNPHLTITGSPLQEAMRMILYMWKNQCIPLSHSPFKKTKSVDKKDFSHVVIGLCENPSSKDKKIHDHVAVRTWESLLYYAHRMDGIFISVNGFYKGAHKVKVATESGKEYYEDVSCTRKKKDLRHLQAYALDFDDIPESDDFIDAIIERCDDLGIAHPNCINRTRAGYQALWILQEPEKAYKNKVRTYDIVASTLCDAFSDLGSDQNAKSANQYIRIPKNIKFVQYNTRMQFKHFAMWALERNIDTNKEEKRESIKLSESIRKSLLNRRAIQNVLKGVRDGYRNDACYALACLMRQAGLSESEAINLLNRWDKLNMDSTCSFYSQIGEIKVRKHVFAAYSSDENDKYPMKKIYIAQKFGSVHKWIRKYPSYLQLESEAVERKERPTCHYPEWIKDIVSFLKQNGGSISGSRKALSEILGRHNRTTGEVRTVPRSTLDVLIDMFRENPSYGVKVDVTGRGRGAKTTLTLIAFDSEPEGTESTSNTIKDNRKVVYLFREQSDQKEDVAMELGCEDVQKRSKKINNTDSYMFYGSRRVVGRDGFDSS